MVLYLAYVCGIPLLYFKVGPTIYMFLLLAYFKVGPPIYMFLLLACAARLLEETSLSLSVGGPRFVGRELPQFFSWFSWATGLRAPVPSSVGRDGFPTRSGLSGRPVVCPSVRLSHVLP